MIGEKVNVREPFVEELIAIAKHESRVVVLDPDW